MDASHYKDVTVHGVQYHYYRVSPISPTHPDLLLLHGFPSTSEHWVHQISYFANKGYGIIAPDMLGYGGTDKPQDPKAFRMNGLALHCVGILDAEGVGKVVVISHDWGSVVASRMANLYPERHLASIFLSSGYLAPRSDISGEKLIEHPKKNIRDILSYWKFFANPEAPKILATHEESFYSIMFTSEPSFWSNHLAPEGELKKFLLGDRRAPTKSWAPDSKRHGEVFRAGGWVAPTYWYRCLMLGYGIEEDKTIPKGNYNIHHPVLLVTTLRDPICLPSLAKASAAQFITNATVHELDTGHWIMVERPDELNIIMSEFLQGLEL